MMRRSRATIRELEERAEIDFGQPARSIVAQMKASLVRKTTGDQRVILEKMKSHCLDSVAETVAKAFECQKMGLLELSLLAKRELAIFTIRGTVPKYRAELLKGTIGIGPSEYFHRYYRDLFIQFDLPTNAISAVDPNLHLHLKRNGEFHKASSSLARNARDQGTK